MGDQPNEYELGGQGLLLFQIGLWAVQKKIGQEGEQQAPKPSHNNGSYDLQVYQ